MQDFMFLLLVQQDGFEYLYPDLVAALTNSLKSITNNLRELRGMVINHPDRSGYSGSIDAAGSINRDMRYIEQLDSIVDFLNQEVEERSHDGWEKQQKDILETLW